MQRQDHAALIDALAYDQASGVFTWRIRPSQRTMLGTIAGSIDTHGYRQIRYRRKMYLAHRLAWLFMTGDWPTMQIDHINGDRLDNRWTNLRQASHSVNSQNRRWPTKRNKSGVLGVFRDGAKWRACIRVKGKTIGLGTFDSLDAAGNAYICAKRRLHEGCTI